MQLLLIILIHASLLVHFLSAVEARVVERCTCGRGVIADSRMKVNGRGRLADTREEREAVAIRRVVILLLRIRHN